MNEKIDALYMLANGFVAVGLLGFVGFAAYAGYCFFKWTLK